MKHATAAAIAVVSLLALAGAPARLRCSACPTTAGSTMTTGCGSSASWMSLAARQQDGQLGPGAARRDHHQVAFLDRSVPQAIESGVHVSFGIHIGKARAITGSPRAIDRFVLWLQKLAWTYPAVTEFVIGNEPNLTRFWQPQFDRRGRNVSGIAFAAFLRSYDALKDVNPNIKVVGVGPRRAATTVRARRATSRPRR